MSRHVVLVAVVLLGVVVGCDDGPDIAGGGVVTGELAGRQEATLDVVSGSDTVVVRAADLGNELFRASTPTGARVVPVADVSESAVRLSLTDSGGKGGAAEVNIDGTVHTGIAGGTVYTPDGWDSATDRYLIDNTAGVSSLTLDRIS